MYTFRLNFGWFDSIQIIILQVLAILLSLIVSWIPVLNTSRSLMTTIVQSFRFFLARLRTKAGEPLISFPSRFSSIKKPSLILKLHFWAHHFLILVQPYFQQTLLFLLHMSSPTLAEIIFILAKKIFYVRWAFYCLIFNDHCSPLRCIPICLNWSLIIKL